MSGAKETRDGAGREPAGTGRPGDVARRALRAARRERAARETRPPEELPAASAPGPDDGGTVSARPAGASGQARPGDVAREALRAAREARGEARAGDTTEPEEQPGRTRPASASARSRSAARRPSAPAGRPTPGRSAPRETTVNRAAELRALLAGAFAVPTAADEARPRPDDTPGHGTEGHGDASGAGPAVTGGSGADAPPGSAPGAARPGAARPPRPGSDAPPVTGAAAVPGVSAGPAAGAAAAPGPGAETGTGAARERAAGAPAASDAPRASGSGAAPDSGAGTTPGATPEQAADVHATPASPRPAAPGSGVPTGPGASSGRAAGAPTPPASPGRAADVPTPSASPGRAADVPTPSASPGRAADVPTPSASPGRAAGAPPPSASPRVPPSMAAPARDGDLRRTFAAFPARRGPGERFAETWWGDAWVGALEQGALDAARLGRGREYARQGHVDAITVTPGLVLGYVQGSRARPYRTQVRLRTLSDGDWERFLDTAAERPGHIAALLDREMPHSLADCGVPLLPGPGDLAPSCSCPDSGHPCKHAAALCYQTARLLDEDPFVLLLLRGRGERELLDALSRRSAARAARAAQDQDPAPLPGVRARDALAPRPLPPLPAPPPALRHPEQPPVHPGAPGGPDPFALDQLATDAAARAHALLGTGRDPVADLTLWQDAVRLAAARPGSGLTAATRALYASLAAATGRTPADLARAVAAWRQGGIDGLAALEEPWDPPAGRFDRARPLLRAADLPAFRPWRNRLTHPGGHLQLRLGRDGLWYAYESEPDRDDWWPRGTPDPDPVGALTGLGAADGL
ncbi:hypothetical protein GCM10010145_14790 [Streptomyces ruber]|uniref:SWIM-type domain-containing protein n=1 Tax=Streptomyces ruber TaxID=83378 RepID=A0A918B8Y7_9ACTN|nr:hypothetical protein GCM10010145_14790 [Streptomyces ruber]